LKGTKEPLPPLGAKKKGAKILREAVRFVPRKLNVARVPIVPIKLGGF
jgi:hypothetical protein